MGDVFGEMGKARLLSELVVHPAPQILHDSKACLDTLPVEDFQHMHGRRRDVLHDMAQKAFLFLAHGSEWQMPAR